MKRFATDMRVCNDCGRPLEIGETCNCRQPVRSGTRDGLRAVCPHFMHRSSYRGRSYIVCSGAKHEYPGSDPRNEHYRRYCCGLFKLCKHYTTMKGEPETCRTRK